MNKLLAIAALTLLSVGLYNSGLLSNGVNYQVKFEQWSTKYNKNYAQTERAFRQSIYEENVRKIEAHNADPTQTYTMGENQFTDLTQEEFVSTYLTLKSHPQLTASEYIPAGVAAPSVDWSTLTKVKNQGQCGSCWAFSAVGAIESVFRVKGGKTTTTDDLSEQQLVDCSKANYGCDGGWPYAAITWAAKNGINLDKDYPYAAVDQKCSASKGEFKVAGYQTVKAANLQAAITNYPVSVCVDATNWSPYKSGVFSDCKKSLNHAVLAVGYQADGAWIIKNSWASNWGESGFIRLASGDTCGVTQEAVIATV